MFLWYFFMIYFFVFCIQNSLAQFNLDAFPLQLLIVGNLIYLVFEYNVRR